jgi:transposase
MNDIRSFHSGYKSMVFGLLHQGPRVKQAIEASGCRLLFLPAHSPDFSPIEEAFSNLKTVLRRIGVRTREALQEAVATALDLITATYVECNKYTVEGFFRYDSLLQSGSVLAKDK